MKVALATSARAASFTAGNIVIYRAGDGSAALSATNAVVFLDEYQTNGTLVQSIQMNMQTNVSGTVTNYPLTCGGNATTEGLMTLSTNNLYLLVPGYGVSPGFNAPSAATGTTVKRVVAVIAADGSTNNATKTALADLASGSSPRGVVSSDGTNIWAAGGGSGVRYFTNGQVTASTQLNAATPLNNRGLGIYGDRLYGSAQTGAYRLWTFGTALSTVTGQVGSNLTGYTTATGDARQFFMTQLNGGGSDPVDTAYVADNGTAGGIVKWSNVSGSWTSNGMYNLNAAGFSGITGVRQIVGSTTNVQLFATASNVVVAVTDSSGFNAAPNGTVTTNVNLGGIATKAFRGIAFAPQSAGCPTITCNVSGPTTVCRTKTNSYSATGSGGASPYTFAWSISSDDGSTFQGGATTASGSSVNVVAGTGGGSYSLSVTPTDADSCVGASACTLDNVSVTTSVTPAISLQSSATNICAGTSVTFTPTLTAGGPSPTYTFYIGVDPVQSGSSATYTTSGLNNGDQVSVVMTSDDPCRSQNTATSSSITMSVEDPPIGGTTSYGGGTVCPGSSVTVSLSGQSGNIQWQFTTGVTPGTFANIGGATSTSVTTNIFSGTNYFRALVSGTLCPSTVSSTTTVYTLARPTAFISGPSAVCAGTTNGYSITGILDLTDTYSWSLSSVAGSATLNTTIGTNVAVTSDSASSYTLVATATGTNGCSRSTTNTVAVNTLVPSVAALFYDFGTTNSDYPVDGWTATAGVGNLFWSNTTAAASSSPFSGGANVTILQGAATNTFLISPTMDFTGLTNGVVSVAVRKSGTFTNDVLVEASINGGTSFDAASAAITTANAANDANYHLVSLSLGSALDNQSQVRVRWHLAGNVGSSAGTYRMDDIKLSGLAPTAAISPAGPITSYTPVTLTATRGSSFLWSPNGETTQSISAPTSGAYSVAITYDNGCPATAAPVSVTVLDPNTFRIVSIVPQGINLLITWMMGPGATNSLQVTTGGPGGSYSTNGFSDILIVTNNTAISTVTNYLDLGAATNVPARYYRARLVP